MLLFVLLYYEKRLFYKLVNKYANLNRKQKAHILSIKTSIVLFTSSFISNISRLPDVCIKFSLIDFMSYLVSDMLIGYKEYPEYLNSLTGFFHHSIYVLITLLSFYTKNR